MLVEIFCGVKSGYATGSSYPPEGHSGAVDRTDIDVFSEAKGGFMGRAQCVRLRGEARRNGGEWGGQWVVVTGQEKRVQGSAFRVQVEVRCGVREVRGCGYLGGGRDRRVAPYDRA